MFHVKNLLFCWISSWFERKSKSCALYLPNFVFWYFKLEEKEENSYATKQTVFTYFLLIKNHKWTKKIIFFTWTSSHLKFKL